MSARRPGVRAPDRVMWVNGELRRGSEATLTLFDRGARDGEGLFETVAVHAGAPVLWERHLERMVLAAAELGFPGLVLWSSVLYISTKIPVMVLKTARRPGTVPMPAIAQTWSLAFLAALADLGGEPSAMTPVAATR